MKYKDTTINGVKYRLGRMSAGDGSWIALLLTEKIRKAREAEGRREMTAKDVEKAVEDAKGVDKEQVMITTAIFLVAQLSRKELKDVQAVCLESCSVIELMASAEVPFPIMEDGIWKRRELEFDGPTVLQLTKESLAFNVSPFFSGTGADGTTANPAP
jgi:hypothetical protein